MTAIGHRRISHVTYTHAAYIYSYSYIRKYKRGISTTGIYLVSFDMAFDLIYHRDVIISFGECISVGQVWRTDLQPLHYSILYEKNVENVILRKFDSFPTVSHRYVNNVFIFVFSQCDKCFRIK